MKRLMALIAGYAGQALACHSQPPLESLFGGLLRAPLKLLSAAGSKQFAGRTALNSGDAYSTISTGIVNSGDLINATLLVNTTCGSGTGFMTAVSSIVDGVSFAYGYVDGQGRVSEPT
ncbi:MAG: hypothetical protein U1E51_07905, partial [Candidatus Binatia bacterium]|nr:hypothetical protein [Candidatus Binatia bacterium]